MRKLDWLLYPLFLILWPPCFILSRLQAKPCPKCGERWFTTLTGEWDGEDWKCGRCNHYWNEPYRKR